MSEELQNGFEQNLNKNITAGGADFSAPPEGVSCGNENIPQNTASAQPSPIFGGNPNYYAKRVYIPFGYTPKTLEERNDLRRLSWVVCVPTLIIYFISNAWSYAYIYIMRLLGFSNEELINFSEEPAFSETLSIVLSCLMFIIPFALTAKIAKYRIDDSIPLGKPKKGTALPLFCGGLGFCVLANMLSNYAASLFKSIGISYEMPKSEPAQGIFGFLLAFISTAIVPALVEEFACRGIIFGVLKKYGNGFAIIASSAVFGIMHGNFNQMFFAFLVGIALGFVRVKSGSVWLCMLIHAANNAISVIMSYSGLTAVAKNVVLLIAFSVLLLVGIIGMSKSFEDDTKGLFESETECTVAQKYKWFMLSPAFIIMSAAFLFEAVSYFF